MPSAAAAAALDAGKLLLWTGMLVRVAVFLALPPMNADGRGHLEHIRYVAKHYAIPLASAGEQTYHPPLYYMLGALIWLVWPGTKAVQALSVALSLLTLWGYYRLILRTEIIPSHEGRLYAFALVALLPQFVLFGLYVSNDTLAIAIGVLLVLQLWQFVQRPTWKNIMLLAGVTGVGLLTKGVFLPLAMVLVTVVLARAWIEYGAISAVARAAGSTIVLSLVGGYKYLESAIHFGNPWISNLDFPHRWVERQKGTVQGWSFLTDVNIVPLLQSPTLDTSTTNHAFHLMLYATFWFTYIPENEFLGNRCAPIMYLGSLIYGLAVIPTALCLVGGLALCRTMRKRRVAGNGPRVWMAAASVTLFLSSVLLLLFVVVRSDVWSVLQARLLFPALFGGLLVFGYGVGAVQRWSLARWIVRISMSALLSVFGLYLLAEVGLQLAIALDVDVTQWLTACAA